MRSRQPGMAWTGSPVLVEPPEEGEVADRALVVDGEVEVDLGDGGLLELRRGDSLYYAGGIPHRWRLIGSEAARLVVVQAAAQVP